MSRYVVVGSFTSRGTNYCKLTIVPFVGCLNCHLHCWSVSCCVKIVRNNTSRKRRRNLFNFKKVAPCSIAIIFIIIIVQLYFTYRRCTYSVLVCTYLNLIYFPVLWKGSTLYIILLRWRLEVSKLGLPLGLSSTAPRGSLLCLSLRHSAVDHDGLRSLTCCCVHKNIFL